MAKWTDYTTDTNPTDTDEVMTLDADKSPKANKRVTLSTLADYFLDKLASKVFAKLETQNQTVIGALNELNSKAFLLSSPTEKLDGIDLNKVTVGIYTIAENCLNTPPRLSRGTLIVSVPEVANYTRQTYIGGYYNDIYSRVKYYNNLTGKLEWKKWETIISE